ncbi:group-specific protein [Niallia taxi]|uniref:group-specific protein n=1 Tax=Niallia taxi TaxID=2499688 RepID=UPI0015F378B3|nr:group-specific protein [Niallia taxi]
MLTINLDEKEVKKIYLEEIKKHLDKMETETLFWDTTDLIKQTRLSWGTIQKEFLYDPRFPKAKLGRKWLFPAEKAKEFLLIWLEEKRY